jgi:hypothetical protein
VKERRATKVIKAMNLSDRFMFAAIFAGVLYCAFAIYTMLVALS